MAEKEKEGEISLCKGREKCWPTELEKIYGKLRAKIVENKKKHYLK